MNALAQRPKSGCLKRLIQLFLLVCLAIYLVLLAFVAISQRKMIYPAPIFTPQQVDEMARDSNLQRWTNSSGEFIGVKRLSPIQPATGQVLILHGNGSYAAGCAHYADEIQRVAGMDVFILEYPGYADRPGTPSEKNLFQAADEAFGLLATNEPVYLLGESLGTGVAAYLAGTHSNGISGLILVSPYNRLADVAQYHMPIFPVHLLLLDRFRSQVLLRNYHGPLGVVVDGQDMVVPEKFGLRLYNGYAGPKQLWEFEYGGHTSIAEPPAKFWREVFGFWQTNRVR